MSSGVPRGKIIGLQVYNPDGTLVGTVQDVILPMGEEKEISLQVLTKYNKGEIVKWNDVGAVGDIIILKNKIEVTPPEGMQQAQASQQTVTPPPAQPTSPAPMVSPTTTAVPQQGQRLSEKLKFWKREERKCPTCGSPLTYIEQYQRWYCYNEGKYI